MRTIALSICICIASSLCAQRDCATSTYIDQQRAADPALISKFNLIEDFIRQNNSIQHRENGEGATTVVRIPVVVHILFSSAAQNISDAQVNSQIAVLNRDFRRMNSDTANTPLRFRALAADCRIEFVLATADPLGRATTGIIHKSTSVSYWQMDDKIKFSSQGGDDAWDSRYYLNLWVGNMKGLLGYASVPGAPADKDGVVISLSAFGTMNTTAPYDLGRTATHEVGHWLGLRHIWGDTYCGDDLVEDTPQQGNFTSGCPTGLRFSCSNVTDGDMYMNFMDFTNDACMNLFTTGQKQRMLALFADGGPRQSLVSSRGLNTPWSTEPADAPLPVNTGFRFYPNPAQEEIVLTMGEEWLGKNLWLTGANGVVQAQITIRTKTQKVNLSGFRPGIYFIHGAIGGEKIQAKFIKL